MSGSFRTEATRRAEDIGVFTEGLQAGEEIIYWKRLPHSAVTRMSSAATDLKVDRRGRVQSVHFDVGRSARVRVIEGIVDWTLFDEKGEPVIWDRVKADQLIDGLRPELLNRLSSLIGNDDETMAAPADEDEPEGELLGEDSAASSMPL